MNRQAQQPTRVVNVRDNEPYDVYIGRPIRDAPYYLQGTGWGNPFHVPTRASAERRAGVIARYRAWLMEQPQLLARLPELRGKRLGCWCAPPGGLTGDLQGRICHGQILAALADGL